MLYYNFAGLKVKINGMDNAQYFRERLTGYEVPSFQNADVTINHSEPDIIEKPMGNVLVHNYPRSFITTENDGCGIYDSLPNSQNLMALVVADKNWTNISTKLLDTINIGGSPNDIRCYNMVGDIIKHTMIMHNRMVFHASAISYNGLGIAFSAPPGTGKSTHTAIWKQLYKENVEFINDDTPAISFDNGIAQVSGLPWSGKSTINKNITVPLKAIVCLERGEDNSISRLDVQSTIFRILNETTKPVFPKMMPELVKRVEQLVLCTPVYLLKCTISADAVNLVKNEIF